MSILSVASRLSSAASKALVALERWFETRIVPSLRRFGEFSFVVAVRNALPYSFGVLLVALIAIILIQPAPGAFFSQSFGLRLSNALLPSFGIMAPALVLALAYFYARSAHLALLPTAFGCAVGFALALPQPIAGGALPYLRALGPIGLFLALLVCGVFAVATQYTRRAWLGATVAIALFAILMQLHISVGAGVAAALVPLAHLGDSYVALILIVLIETLLWTAGIHGPATLAAVVTPLYLALQAQNTQAYSHHQPLPHIVVVSLFLFVFPGGAGATLPLAGMLALSRVTRLRRIGRVALIPSFFNVNEPLIFGAPIVFNPYLAIPFIIAPLVLATVTYVVVALGAVARPAFYMPSSLSTFVSTYLATLDPRAIALVALNIVIAALIYWPFVRAYERHAEQTQ